ncbi:phytanoyl-CoA dioxygenase family protein [Dyadobacter psychrophilus]|uniref:Ectoine hydroxylase-related dioxygenase, phytanoyl-CoA dioxygenase (PhyH) family n=1 Tax=Dyadobacter psychrophilus TaxID=651661 RepID=A0A1T5EG34_9BACT|nr:phytanoyl-CoA dioxygenase family protein [Dyadobacter psychrophilus]SKB82728.1 Ectoine hydroxylase-related dioxygenase, phytanoyl-CoA dioxygenase (PhyH) family [Dyadobacter psychrophilus]
MQFTPEHLESYHRDGYVVVREFFSKKEVELLYRVATTDDVITSKSYDRTDAAGLKTKLALWYALDESIYSKFARSERIVNAVEQILDGKAAHYHSKLMQKEPRTGGAWEWHQDYGYWYKNNGFLLPEMLSVITALTPATKENGCLQMIRGSHKMGRVEHGFSGEQVGADMEKVTEALKIMPLDYLEMGAGDTAFFHCNVLHASAANLSDHPRWSIITAYNLASNKPYKDVHTSSYTPIEPFKGDLLTEEVVSISDQADFLIK